MTFQFTKPAEGEIGLEDAITQALLSSANDASLGVTIQEIREALMLEILRKQKAINDRHEVEVSTWKKRLVEETADLRRILEDRRERLRGLLDNHFPGHATSEGDIMAFSRLDVLLARIPQVWRNQAVDTKTVIVRPHKPE